MYDNGDILLFALSSWRKVSWTAFKKCFDEVHRRAHSDKSHEQDENATVYRWRVIRTLSCLGHVDLDRDSGDLQLVAAPTVLSALPGFGIRKVVLCGARSPHTMRELREAAVLNGVKIIVRPQTTVGSYAPTRVELQSESDTRVRAIAEHLGIPYLNIPPARSIAHASASLRDYCQGLTWSKGEDLNWKREDFDIDNLQFRSPVGRSNPLRLSRYQDPVKSTWRYYLWRNSEFSEIDLDWGRYAILAMYSKQVLQYDQRSKKVFIPSGTPLPVLLARVFGLCSGYSSYLIQRKYLGSSGRLEPHEVFENVPPSIFKAVAKKIEQQII